MMHLSCPLPLRTLPRHVSYLAWSLPHRCASAYPKPSWPMLDMLDIPAVRISLHRGRKAYRTPANGAHGSALQKPCGPGTWRLE
jgi:hypothetical protein